MLEHSKSLATSAALVSLVALASSSCSDKAPISADTGADSAAKDATGNLDDGSTGSAEGGTGTLTCNPAKITCRALPAGCAVGKVHQVVGGCWGDCVPIEQCADLPARPRCDLSSVLCYREVPTCVEPYVPTASGSCYGPCVPDTTCACEPNGPAGQCPSDRAPVCWQEAKRCGPLD